VIEHVPLTLEHVERATDDARKLIGELDAVLHADSPPEQRHGLSVERIFQPGVMFFIARLAGEAVGCGGVAFLAGGGGGGAGDGNGGGLAEVKRMYVRPAARGRDVARTILARLEAEACARGASRLVLETGDNRDAAIRLYERAGFTRCAAFGAYATMPPRAIERSVFMEKRIDAK
jgi:putative acetyltransferase